MKFKTRFRQAHHSRWLVKLLATGVLLTTILVNAEAQKPKKTGAIMRSISYEMPYGYVQVGNTDLCYSKEVTNYNNSYYHSIDIQGKFNSYYYGSTYGNHGYDVAIKVGNNSATYLDCRDGSTVNGVSFEAEVIAQADLARVCYYLTNTNDKDTVISLGIHADVMIGDNDSAPIVRKKDTTGSTYGLALLDGNGAQLCVLFGSGLPGVTGISDFWFGGWSLNSSPSEMVGNYYSGSNWMIENGSYDSGMGWCWKDRIIPAGETVIFSWLIGVGEVNLEPNSSFEVTPEDPEGWNDLSRLHVLTLEGDYESPAGLSGKIEYAVEDSEEWIALTEMIESGSTFTGEVRAMFDPTRSSHIIRFRTVDQVGNTTLLPSIVYPDVAFHNLSGITSMTYTGEALFQTGVTCDLAEEQYTLTNYQNNVNAGTASFNLDGVFPYTIGRKTYTFTINPQPLSGTISLTETEFVYNGQYFTPDWQFTNEAYANLEEGTDYNKVWSSNRLPGTGTLTVTGKNNYQGTLSANITIDKAPLTDALFTLTLPEEDITYDGQSHGASITKATGVGEATITYQKQGEAEATTTLPSEAGDYTIYLAFAEGSLYYGRESTQVGTFSIYSFNAEEWAILQTVLSQLSEMGWSQPWDVSQGMSSVSSLHGLTIERGHVTSLDLSGQNLTGDFPYSVLALSQLTSINLANNHLSGDVGTVTYTFAQEHPSQMGNVQVINISGNQFSGNIGLFANCFGSLTSLDASNNCLEDVYPVIPSTVTTLNIGKQTISRVVPVYLTNLSVETFASSVPSILLYDHASQSYTKNINLLCTTQDNSWGMTLAYQNGTLSIPYVSEPNAYYGESGDALNVAVVYNNGTHEGSTFQITLSFDQGDGNFDGQVNVLDLQTTINYIFENYKTRPFNFTAANLWEDELINVQDIICLVNLLISMDTADEEQTAGSRRLAPANGVADAVVYVQDNQLMINTCQAVAAFDFTVSGAYSMNIAKALSQAGFTFSMKKQADGLHIIGYSLNGASIPTGITKIGTFDTNAVSVRSVMLSDSDANAISASCDSSTTGLESVGKSTADETVTYDLQGRRVDSSHLRKGVYVKKGRIIVK